jgi:hypothetical protein
MAFHVHVKFYIQEAIGPMNYEKFSPAVRCYLEEV